MSLRAVLNFRVLDESADWLVVDKPAPLIVHPANRNAEPTLLGGVEQLLAYEIQNGARPAIVTRLDRDTSGIVLVAKHYAAARELGMIFERREARKQYLAVVCGWPEADAWHCDEPLLRAGDMGPSDIWVRQQVHPSGRPSITGFRVERRFELPTGRFAQVRCFPVTGRMHQLRVHLAHAGFPIVGDKIYQGTGAEYLEWMEQGWTRGLQDRLLLPRHALHAAALEIPWQGVPVRWSSELPSDLTAFCAGGLPPDVKDGVEWTRPEPLPSRDRVI